MSELFVSASSLRLLQECPRAWSYRYLAGHKPEDVSPSLVLGRACHPAIALLYEHIRLAKPEPGEADLVATARGVIDAAIRDAIPIARNDNDEDVDLSDEATRMIRAFLASPLRPKKVVAIETPFSVSLDRHPTTGERFDFEEVISGVFDLVIEDDLGLAVVDHKVARRRPPIDTGVDLQLALYAFAAERLFERPVRLFHQVLLRAKVAHVELREIARVPRDTAEAIEAVASGVTLIHAAVGHSQPSRLLGRRRSWRCSGCCFRRRCSADRT